ncbi:MAG: pilus assembly protein PilZ [Myxococcales bacterium]|nr:pilus assembly protein PilZ [Myxococcales bacterium]
MDKRRTLRFDKVFAVSISSSTFGECQGIARNISAGGMFVELSDPLPLGSAVRVHFTLPDTPGEIVARGEVKGHYFVNFADAGGPRSLTGMGVRFVGFDEGAEGMISGRMGGSRNLH